MEVINITKARDNLYKLVSIVSSSHVPVLIKGKDTDAVLVSADDWRAIEETLYLMRIPGMVESIKKASAEPLEECTHVEEVEW